MRTDTSTLTRPAATANAVVELRQYTLKPGSRDALIELFDREFVETQEALGMAVLGQFRDLDDPERFVDVVLDFMETTEPARLTTEILRSVVEEINERPA